jgi:hypothetical protein
VVLNLREKRFLFFKIIFIARAIEFEEYNLFKKYFKYFRSASGKTEMASFLLLPVGLFISNEEINKRLYYENWPDNIKKPKKCQLHNK